MKQKSEIEKPKKAEIVSSEYAREWVMEGADSSDLLMPRVVLHQGKISEKAWGKNVEGAIINSVTRAEIYTRKFVPLFGFKEWIRWSDNRTEGYIYRHRDRAHVPPADLAWNGDVPPSATVYRNVVVLFDGESMPVCLSLKDSSRTQRQAGKLINQMEAFRAKTKQSPGLYEIVIAEVENEKGRWYDMSVRTAGNPPPELAAAAAEMARGMAGLNVVVSHDEPDDEPAPADAASRSPQVDDDTDATPF